jgi:uncharacterized repeat protein (TIGR01451 family)
MTFGQLRNCARFAALATVFVVPFWGQSYITGANTGAEHKLSNAPDTVTFTLTVNGAGTYSLAGGIYYLKSGTTTTGNVTFSIVDTSSTVLASVTQSQSQFCSGFANCQQYAYHTFTFASPVSLPGSGATYTVLFTSDADPEQNSAYFVKGSADLAVATGVVPATADLTVTKDVGSTTFNLGQSGAAYDIRVNNIGSGASSGTVTVTDTLDANLSYVSAAGTGWACGHVGQVVTCTSSTAIAAGGTASAITLTVNVASSGETSVTNNVAVSGGGETNTANDTFQLVTNVSVPDLTVTKDASPSTFSPGQTGVTYNLRVSNIGAAASTGTVAVTDTLDANLSYVSATGTGWSCGAVGHVVTCTSTTAIAAAGNAAVIVLTADVVSNGETSVTNHISVSGGGQTNTTNDTFQLVTNVGTPPSIPALSTLALAMLALLLGGFSMLLLKGRAQTSI